MNAKLNQTKLVLYSEHTKNSIIKSLGMDNLLFQEESDLDLIIESVVDNLIAYNPDIFIDIL